MVNQDIHTDLQYQALSWTALLIGAGTWIGLLVADLVSLSLPTELIGGAVATISVCGVLYILRNKYLRLACYIAVAWMWTSNTLVAFQLPQPLHLYLFGFIILLSSRLIEFMATIILSALSTAVVIVLAGGQAQAVGPLINLWGSLRCGCNCFSRPL